MSGGWLTAGGGPVAMRRPGPIESPEDGGRRRPHRVTRDRPSEGTAMAWLEDELSAMPVWWALSLVFLLPALEPALPVVGMLLPSQTALVTGGVLAHRGVLPVAGVLAGAVFGSLAGNLLGYAVGRKCGAGVTARLLPRVVASHRCGTFAGVVRRYSGRAVVLGRFNMALRAFVPLVCGTARLPLRRFLAWSLLGGLLWGPAFVSLGLLAGASWQEWGGPGMAAGASILVLLITTLPVFGALRRGRLTGTGTRTPRARSPLGPGRSGLPRRPDTRTRTW
ncbi:DedA family protein [Streptomyces sp. WAC05858]|nr:DedA family protein [Streptomyces sp. WAC05858]